MSRDIYEKLVTVVGGVIRNWDSNQPLHRTPSALARLGAGERRR